jgi:hypothetical protein
VEGPCLSLHRIAVPVVELPPRAQALDLQGAGPRVVDPQALEHLAAGLRAADRPGAVLRLAARPGVALPPVGLRVAAPRLAVHPGVAPRPAARLGAVPPPVDLRAAALRLAVHLAAVPQPAAPPVAVRLLLRARANLLLAATPGKTTVVRHPGLVMSTEMSGSLIR